MQNTVGTNNQQELPNGDMSTVQQDQTNNPQYSWTTDTVVVNGNPVRVIYPNLEDSN